MKDQPRLLLSMLVFGLSVISLRAQDDATPLITKIEAIQSSNRQALGGLTLSELMQRFNVPGFSIAVIRDLKVHWTKAYGIADVESNRPVEKSTVFQAASSVNRSPPWR
jgi:CubicO group peptidase (beta-lactamase class C family)